ncbi:MAG: polyphosphate polymerase domain-containing protein [Flavobacteriales bacterium]|jgi:hypothetical protein|nr:polyphosphate polymerase domain-containing protein [Flavobacteriales bacterium]
MAASATTDVLDTFAPISLADMDGVKLQDRVDTKYVFGEAELPEVLAAMLPHYRVLEVNGMRGTKYSSLYYDTADLQHYKDHHNGRTFRSKVRFREYLGADLVFLEVKRKTGRGRTDKKRILVPAIPLTLDPSQQEFVSKANGQDHPLHPTLWNHFTRYTFVNKHSPERLTMDVDLRYSDPAGERVLGGVVIAELKQERADRTSPFVRIMRKRVVAASGMSKYCIGMLLMERDVKHNAFKQVLLKLERIRNAA